MEKEIMGLLRERNGLLHKFLNLNLEILSYSDAEQFDVEPYLAEREGLLSLLRLKEDQISAASMSEWKSFKLDTDYKNEFIILSSEKKRIVAKIVQQDLILINKLEDVCKISLIA